MKTTRMLLPVLFTVLSLSSTYAQEKQTGEAPASQVAVVQIPVKVQMILTEYDGAKKISSMPYTMSFLVSRNDKRESLGLVRSGIRFPVTTGITGDKSIAYQYLDIGTNIDCWVWKWKDDRYLLNGTVDVSSLYVATTANAQPDKKWNPGEPISGFNPIVRQSKDEFSIPLRDGQTGEATVATEPITGHVFKVEATLNIVK